MGAKFVWSVNNRSKIMGWCWRQLSKNKSKTIEKKSFPTFTWSDTRETSRLLKIGCCSFAMFIAMHALCYISTKGFSNWPIFYLWPLQTRKPTVHFESPSMGLSHINISYFKATRKTTFSDIPSLHQQFCPHGDPVWMGWSHHPLLPFWGLLLLHPL